MIRAFLAIDLPASLRPILLKVQDELKASGADVRWVPVGNIHLTLKFFGEISEAQVEALAQAAGRVAAAQPPFSLRLTTAGAFPGLKSPRVVWLGVGGALQIITQFQRQLEEAFVALGYPLEGRPFSPHLTLGRVRSPRERQELSRRLATVAVPESPPFSVSEIVLFRSNLSPQGATYLPLKVIVLGTGSGKQQAV